MPTIRHNDDVITVEVINEYTHRGETIYQVQTPDSEPDLRDESGDAPFMFESEVAGVDEGVPAQ